MGNFQDKISVNELAKFVECLLSIPQKISAVFLICAIPRLCW
jgi:hypothetical protein